ncbi:MAG TPA: MoxR family ATPase [Nitrospira sp.]|nr:MoxR family ATPase [Nitrospira sp.]
MTMKAQHLECALRNHLDQMVFGMERIIHGLCVALIAGGHVLLQGPPGLGKTLLAKSLAAKLGGTFKRIQGTTDLMPSDITGLHVYDREANKFEFVPGPLFADVVLVDEINRIGPKTQSALLQAMEECQVSIDRQTYPLPDDFFVIATQNPHEFEGTFPLPEAQLDRFLLRLEVTYPEPVMEQQVMRTYDLPRGGHAKFTTSASELPKSSVDDARREVEGTHVSDCMYRYVTDIAGASRVHPHVSLGASTRGALGVMRCARIEAALRGGDFVTPDDVKAVAQFVLAHRLVLTPDALLEGIQASQVVEEILGQVPVPRE